MKLGLPQDDQSFGLDFDPSLPDQDLVSSTSNDQSPGDSPSCWQKVWQRCLRNSNKTINDLRRIEANLKEEEKVSSRWSWVESLWMNSVFGFLILLSSICIGVDIELSGADGESHPVMVVIESVFLACFWVELILRLIAHGIKNFCLDPWGPLDFMVTFLGSLDAWVLNPFLGGSDVLSGVSALRTLRLLRLARLLRVFRHFKQLSRLVKQVIGALKALFWVSVLLVLMVYVSVIFNLILLDCDDTRIGEEKICQGMGWAFFSHFTVVTGEGYLDFLVTPTVALNKFWYAYWVMVVTMLNFVMISLVSGIIVQRVMADKAEEEDEMANFVHEAAAFRKALYTLFELNDANQDGVLDSTELAELMESDRMLALMEAFGIKTDVPGTILIGILGFQREKYISFKRFYESCVRVCAASKDLRSFMLQYDIAIMKQEGSDLVSRIMRSTPSLPDLDAAAKAGKKVGNWDYGIKAGKPKGSSSSTTAKASKAPAAVPARANLPVKGPAAITGAPVCVCSARKGSGFSEAFAAKAQLAKKRLFMLERRQEELLLVLGELRKSLFGSSGAVCCPKGHPLLPLGTAFHPVGNVGYRYWSCDAAAEAGPCRNGQIHGSHLTQWRRYHCARCKYDMCEPCYQHRLSGGKKPQGYAQKIQSHLPAPPVPKSQWWEAQEEHTPGTKPPKVARAGGLGTDNWHSTSSNHKYQSGFSDQRATWNQTPSTIDGTPPIKTNGP